MKRRKKVIIKTQCLTPEEVAKELGVSKKRLAWLMKVLEDVQKEFIDDTKKPKRKPRK